MAQGPSVKGDISWLWYVKTYAQFFRILFPISDSVLLGFCYFWKNITTFTIRWLTLTRAAKSWGCLFKAFPSMGAWNPISNHRRTSQGCPPLSYSPVVNDRAAGNDAKQDFCNLAGNNVKMPIMTNLSKWTLTTIPLWIPKLRSPAMPLRLVWGLPRREPLQSPYKSEETNSPLSTLVYTENKQWFWLRANWEHKSFVGRSHQFHKLFHSLNILHFERENVAILFC